MEQTANTMPAAALGQYKGLAFTRRVRPVSEKAVEADIGNHGAGPCALCADW